MGNCTGVMLFVVLLTAGETHLVFLELDKKEMLLICGGTQLCVVGEGSSGEDKCTFLAIGFCPHLPPPARNHQPTHPHYN